MENHSVDKVKVRQFWEWFSQNCHDFGAAFDNPVLLAKLDNWVAALGNFAWEIGPGKKSNNALVISPGGDLELLEKTKEIIANAKECSGWEYYSAKPPKVWELRFNFKTAGRNRIEIDASGWEYCLLQYEDGMFTIIIKAPGLAKLDDKDRLTAAEITLDGVIGEEMRMETICEIDVVDDFEMSYQNKHNNIRDLLAHLKTLNK